MADWRIQVQELGQRLNSALRLEALSSALRIETLTSAVRLRFASLPTRIIAVVFLAALVTGVAVSLTSTRSTERFLREKIDERFPQLLHDSARRFDQWYTQRELDIATFAASDTVAASLRDERRPLTEARRYLAYVQEGFPQYRRLFVLDKKGRTRVAVGPDLDLPETLLSELTAVDRRRISAMMGNDNERFQVISAPIERSGTRLGSLHAVISVESLTRLLAVSDIDPNASISVIGPAATVLASSRPDPERRTFERVLPAPDSRPGVETYTTPSGDRVVGSAVPFRRFGWTLAVEQDYEIAFAPVVSATRQVMAINSGIVLGFSLLALMIARSIVQPVRLLSEGARRIADGDTDVAIPEVEGNDEIAVLSQALHEMVERLRLNQIELQKKQEQIERANVSLTHANKDLQSNNEVLEQLSFTDGLTRLHNHRYFQDRMRVETKRCGRSKEPLALLLVDIDDFKGLNDQHGHAAGDAVLRSVAATLSDAVRDTDIPARYGGEEFAVLAPRTELEGAVTLGEKLRTAIAESKHDAGEAGSLKVTVSVGVALYESDPRKFFNEADRALYQAKGSGKDCVVAAESSGGKRPKAKRSKA